MPRRQVQLASGLCPLVRPLALKTGAEPGPGAQPNLITQI